MEVKVSAPGYEAWVYPILLFHLKFYVWTRSEMHLDIHLKPAHDQSLPVSKFLIPQDTLVGYAWSTTLNALLQSSRGRSEDSSIYWCSVLETSSLMPEDSVERQYFYYAPMF